MLTFFRKMGNAGRVATQYMKLRHTPQPFKTSWPTSSPIDSTVPILGIFPEPQPCTGPDLLRAIMGVCKLHARKQYRKMSEENKVKLEDADGKHYEHRRRIWQGYEIVEWRKRNDENPDGDKFDPYVNSGLAPWEIVKDKLRKSRKLKLSLDCYDSYIRQALRSKLLRTPFDMYYTNHRLNINGTSRKNANKKFSEIDLTEMEQIETMTKRNNEHILWSSKVPASNCEFQHFYRANVDYSCRRPLFDVMKKWEMRISGNPMGMQGPSYTTETHEMKLDMWTAIVLDYVYYAGTVEGIPSDYSWAQDMGERVGGLVYLPGGYSNISPYKPMMWKGTEKTIATQ